MKKHGEVNLRPRHERAPKRDCYGLKQRRKAGSHGYQEQCAKLLEPCVRERSALSRDMQSPSHFSRQALESTTVDFYFRGNCYPESLIRVPGCWNPSIALLLRPHLGPRHIFC